MPGEERFPRSERLIRRSEFLLVYREGEKWMGEAFILHALRQPGQGRKVGCAVSRKVGRAVVRNRVKRYIREVYRKNRARLANDVYLVIVARPCAATLDYHQCEEAIRWLFRKGDLVSG